MTAEDSLKLIDGFFAAQNAADAARLAGCFTDEGTWEVAGLATSRGREEILAFAQATLRGYSDIRVRVLDAIADNDRVFALVEYSGKLTGTLQRAGLPPIEPTGRSATAKYMVRARVEGGRIAELFQVTNVLDVYRQFGVLT